jgi:hypothetical protein
MVAWVTHLPYISAVWISIGDKNLEMVSTDRMFVFTPSDGLCCVRFIYPVLCWCWCPEIWTSSIDWAQLSKLLPEDGDRIQSPKRCVILIIEL